MGRQASRPITIEFADTDSPIYIPLARERENMSIQLSEGSGITSVDVDITNDNIIRGPANSYDVHSANLRTPANAAWNAIDATLTAANPTTGVYYSGFETGMALRLVVNTGTGTGKITVTQST
jgi:hypothetical protein